VVTLGKFCVGLCFSCSTDKGGSTYLLYSPTKNIYTPTMKSTASILIFVKTK